MDPASQKAIETYVGTYVTAQSNCLSYHVDDTRVVSRVIGKKKIPLGSFVGFNLRSTKGLDGEVDLSTGELIVRADKLPRDWRRSNFRTPALDSHVVIANNGSYIITPIIKDRVQ